MLMDSTARGNTVWLQAEPLHGLAFEHACQKFLCKRMGELGRHGTFCTYNSPCSAVKEKMNKTIRERRGHLSRFTHVQKYERARFQTVYVLVQFIKVTRPVLNSIQDRSGSNRFCLIESKSSRSLSRNGESGSSRCITPYKQLQIGANANIGLTVSGVAMRIEVKQV